MVILADPNRKISIHAPARGATPNPNTNNLPKMISIHAPARGATLTIVFTAHTQTISIHAPARGATQIKNMIDRINDISIHAPARGATLLYCSRNRHDENFNPRSREGSDLLSGSETVCCQSFQSTLPRGERLYYKCCYMP